MFDWYMIIMKFKDCYTDEQIDLFTKTNPPKITVQQANEIKTAKHESIA